MTPRKLSSNGSSNSSAYSQATKSNAGAESTQARASRLLSTPCPDIPPGLESEDDEESQLVSRWRQGDLDLDRLNSLSAAKLYTFCIRHKLADAMSTMALRRRDGQSHIDLVTLTTKKIDAEGVKWLMQWATLHGRPLNLAISRSINDPESFQALATGLQLNRNIVAIDLSRCTMSVGAMRPLCAALKYNQGLHRLILRHCHLDQQSVGLIGAALKVNTSLQLLDLTATKIDDDALAVLAQSLSGASGLRSLNLSENKFHAEGVQALARACSPIPPYANCGFARTPSDRSAQRRSQT